MAQPNTTELPKLFDANGTLTAVLGGPGEGPGEYRDATLVYFDATDSIVVVDQTLGRLSVLDRQGRFSRSFRVPHSTLGVVRLSQGPFVLSAHQARPSEAGLPLRVFESDGTLRLAFGSDAPEYDIMHPVNQVRYLALGSNGGVWSVPLARRYVIELWGVDGHLRKRFVRDVDWFRPYTELKNINASSPPQPRVAGIWSAGDSVVGVLLKVPDRRWRSGLGPAKTFEGSSITEIRDRDLVFDSVIEIIHVPSATVLSSTRMDRALSGVAGPSTVYSVEIRDDGFAILHLFKVASKK